MSNARIGQAVSGLNLSTRSVDASHGEPAAEPPGSPHGDDFGSIVDFQAILDYARSVSGAVRRHLLLGLTIFVTVTVLAVALTLVLPKTYRVQAKLLAQRNSVMTALSNPGRAIPWDADAPTRAAAETVLRRDNLVSLVKQTNLIERWRSTRAPAGRLKDWVMTSILRARSTEEDQLDALIDRLEERLTVETGSTIEGTVTISIDWPDAQLAYELVQAAQQAFIEARQVAETSAIAESISILERYSATLHQEIERTIQQSEQAAQASRGSSRATRRSTPSLVADAVASTPPTPIPPLPSLMSPAQMSFSLQTDPEVNRLQSALSTKRQEVQSLEQMRQQQLADAQARLAQLRTIYTETHPSVLNAQQNVATLSRESAQLSALRAQEQAINAEYERRAAASTVMQEAELKAQYESRLASMSSGSGTSAAAKAEPRPAPVAAPREMSRDQNDYSTLLFRLQLGQLQNVLERTDGARIELAVSQAAFKYRYTVVKPAQVPRKPEKPDVVKILFAGLLAAFVLAIAAVVIADLRSQRIFEPWQLERQLGLPAFGVMRSA